MDRLQFCTKFIGDCHSCVENKCFYIQFGNPNVWTCVDELNGWKDVQRIIAYNFLELCDRVFPTTPTPFIHSAMANIPAVSSGFPWISGGVDLFLFCMMVVGFYILFVKNRQLIQAIEGIPEHVEMLYAQRNHYYHQLEVQGNNDYERNRRNLELSRPPSVPPPSIPARRSHTPAPLPPPPPHQHIDMESDSDDEAETSFSILSDSSPEVIQRETVFTQSGRAVRRPDFLGC